MAATTPTRRRPSVAARRLGYLVAAVVNAALVYAVNVWPGWQAVPFLSEETRQVLGLVNLSLTAGLVTNVMFLRYDPPRLKSLGDLVTTAIGLAVLVRVWRVFPFEFQDLSFDWALLVRIVLGAGMFGAAVGMVVSFVSLVRPPLDRATEAGCGGTGR